MRVFADTSVLVASILGEHPHHAAAFTAISRVADGLDEGFISAHSLAEVYAVLTRIPIVPRIQPAVAAAIVAENLCVHFTVVPLDAGDFVAVIDRLGALGISGGKIYDALLLKCAEKCGAERVMTLNRSDFQRLASDEMAALLWAP